MAQNLNPVPPELFLWEEALPGGCHWSGILRRGNALRLTDLTGRANVSALFYNTEEKLERYNMPDTLKAQHTAHLTKGHVCYSDMGHVLCSVIADTCGWHDTVCGTSNAGMVGAKYGDARHQTGQVCASAAWAGGRALLGIGKGTPEQADAAFTIVTGVLVDRHGLENWRN